MFKVLRPSQQDRAVDGDAQDAADAMVGQSKLAEAINYPLNHWDGLTLFLSDGRVEVDSDTVERSMRPIAMGRRNSLFSGSEGGAESWAILASLVNTAKLHDLDPGAYLPSCSSASSPDKPRAIRCTS
jgi:transposase